MNEINIKRPGQILDYTDTKEHLLKLFNYITNLQQENQQLKEKRDVLVQRGNEYREKITDLEIKLDKVKKL